jgi:IS5 family transposase
MKITGRCGESAVAGLNEALLAKAAAAKVLRYGVRGHRQIVVERKGGMARDIFVDRGKTGVVLVNWAGGRGGAVIRSSAPSTWWRPSTRARQRRLQAGLRGRGSSPALARRG